MAPTAPSATGEPGTPTRCPGCFSDTGGTAPCPRCGFDPNEPGPVSALGPGTVLHEQFVIGRVLGKPGGFGITYLARDRALATRVAIKEYLPRDLAVRAADGLTIAPHSTADADTFRFGLSQFLEEARTLARLDHPNIVRVRQFFSAHGSAYLVMDYYQGLSLAEYLARQPDGRLSEPKALALMQPILDGLRAVHAEGFLHRDIKPANIYLARTQSGGARPILLDFGAARQSVGERSRSLSVLVTDGYAPFEQYSRKGRQGPWTDVYAAAAVLYRVLTGQTPPPAPERIDEDELKPTSDFGISQPLSDAVALALAVRPEGRPQTVEAWQRQLQRQVTASDSSRVSSGAASAKPVTRLGVEPDNSKSLTSASPETKSAACPQDGDGRSTHDLNGLKRRRARARRLRIRWTAGSMLGFVIVFLLFGRDWLELAAGVLAAERDSFSAILLGLALTANSLIAPTWIVSRFSNGIRHSWVFQSILPSRSPALRLLLLISALQWLLVAIFVFSHIAS